MLDDHTGGLLAFVIAAPIMEISCDGGGVILAAIAGGAQDETCCPPETRAAPGSADTGNQ